METKADPMRPWKAVAAFVLAFLTALYATLQGRETLEGMSLTEWLVVLLGAVVTAGATYMIRNPQVSEDHPGERGSLSTVLAVFVALVMAAITAVFALGATTSPAQAGWFNDVTHASSDTGNIQPVQIQCEDGRRFFLYRGMSSPPRCGAHVRRIIPAYNQMVVCHNHLPPYQSLTYMTALNVPSGSSLVCFSRNLI